MSYRMSGRINKVSIRSHFSFKDVTTDSSVGRAGDCRSNTKSDISRSLVQIRLGGLVLGKPGKQGLDIIRFLKVRKTSHLSSE